MLLYTDCYLVLNSLVAKLYFYIRRPTLLVGRVNYPKVYLEQLTHVSGGKLFNGRHTNPHWYFTHLKIQACDRYFLLNGWICLDSVSEIHAIW